MSLKTFTREEVTRHNVEGDLWIIIDASVYDMSRFVDMHPGGAFPILEFAGKDATDDFYGLHRQDVLVKYDRYRIGTIANEQPQIEFYKSGEMSKVPYAESSAWMGFKSPYFNDSHFKFRVAVRKICDSLADEARAFEDAGTKPSDEFMKKLGENHLLSMNIGPGPMLHGLMLPSGLKGEDFDYFHEIIVHEETARWKVRGFDDGSVAGMVISAPTIINFGTPALKKKYIPDIFSGKKRICLAITEAFAGSDVARIRTTAVKTADGKHYLVNGTKKWITGGCWADLFSVAVQTDKGMSMLLIERSEGVETKPIKTSYSPSAGTAYVTFENVLVPVENLLGKENQGFVVVLSNFNHERFVMITQVSMSARLVIEECFKWANQRKVFGKRLIDQPVIRNKLAKMVASLESVHAWMENIAYQMNNMTYDEQSEKLAGPIALLKYQATRMIHDVSDDACQIFGGRAITKTGMGRTVETLQRTYKFSAILGGAEEIMADLGIRQAMKYFPRGARL
ncbi:acyl-CoA dehydrogenase/oxidase [Mucor mucedo]|uniref:acyl-CoA dehydrogenase/oxidase n=1 Tax=Mucor mucedo TaxID=29922 RepID=UPI00221F7007|nr:acyl-CoA dehydrogenase/oxidase [Mucor mucedo]KAI7895633.1 acyl-CoA dehydrogenase/oxidase [Mucor mucedo]